jgi:enediyne biosynthesis protein E4
VGTSSNRDGIGAKVRVRTATRDQWNRVTTSVGYGGSSDRVAHFGLGSEEEAEAVEIEWPSGIRQTIVRPGGDRYVRVVEPGK